MTDSELHAVMVGGFGTIAGSVLATYIAFGVGAIIHWYHLYHNYEWNHVYHVSINLLQIPANHLISASIMAAPCALAISKLSFPETEKSNTTEDDVKSMEPR